jgi:hypothetical protein
MRAVKIDPVSRTVTEINLTQNPNKTFDEIYSIIGCNLVQMVYLDAEIVMLCDEEGRLKPIQGAFNFLGNEDMVIAGTAVILGNKRDSFRSLPEHLRTFEMITQWVKPEDVPAPQHNIFAVI